MTSKMDDLMSRLRRQKFLSLAVMLFVLSTGIVIGTVITHGVAARDQMIAPGATPLTIPPPAVFGPNTQMFVNIAKTVRPAVVNINTTSVIKHPATGRQGRQAVPPDSDFQDFFNRFFNGMPSAPEGNVTQRSLGSGVVVDRNGYILTNRHVIDKADKIQVKLLNDPTTYVAKVIGSDYETDLAVIKIEAKRQLDAVKLGNSDGMNVGDWVLAFGSPFGLDETVTAGIISAKGRDLQDSNSQFQHFLQTDAAINPGNSGGPLVNMAGEVIGINTAILTQRGAYEGVGFALPSNMAAQVYNQIIKTGKVQRGSIGITFQSNQSNNPALLQAFGVKEGVLINEVKEGGPADKAGLKSGDVIVAVNGEPIKDGNDLVNKISQTPVGQSVRVKYIRDGKPADATVAIADREKLFPDLNPDADQDTPGEADQSAAKFGITLQNMTPELANRLGIGNIQGVLVQQVDPSSFADDVGLASGDIIVEIGVDQSQRQPVRSIEDVKRIQRNLKNGQVVVFKVMRRSAGTQFSPLFLAGTIGQQ